MNSEQPPFKVGDKIKYITQYSGLTALTYHNIYVVNKVFKSIYNCNNKTYYDVLIQDDDGKSIYVAAEKFVKYTGKNPSREEIIEYLRSYQENHLNTHKVQCYPINKIAKELFGIEFECTPIKTITSYNVIATETNN